MGITDRIKQIIEYKDISTRKFCIEIGVANGFLDKVKDVGSEKVLKILKTYPDINPNWLITGEGNMLKESGLVRDILPEYGLNSEMNKLKKENLELKDKIIELYERIDKIQNDLISSK